MGILTVTTLDKIPETFLQWTLSADNRPYVDSNEALRETSQLIGIWPCWMLTAMTASSWRASRLSTSSMTDQRFTPAMNNAAETSCLEESFEAVLECDAVVNDFIEPKHAEAKSRYGGVGLEEVGILSIKSRKTCFLKVVEKLVCKCSNSCSVGVDGTSDNKTIGYVYLKTSCCQTWSTHLLEPT